jgi:hypothetical protein
MAWARWQRCTGNPTRHEVNLKAIPILPAGEWRLYGPEDMPLIGAAPKSYLAYGDFNRPDCQAYFAKKGTRPLGAYRDCVTEEIISKVGQALPLRMARSRLVRLPVPFGAPPDVRFMSRNFVRRGEQLLLHGLEVVAEYLNTKPDEVHRVFNLDDSESEHRFYTVHHLVAVLRWFCREDDKERSSVLDGFARMLAFDALVGAPDRHAMNWGLLVPLSGNTRPVKFAPLFDTARGMFREMTDARLKQIERNGEREDFIRNYARKSRPVFGIGEAGPERCNHFQLVQCALNDFPGELGDSIGRFIRGVRMPELETLVRRKFRRIISPTRVSFILGLLRHRHNLLKNLLERPSGSR